MAKQEKDLLLALAETIGAQFNTPPHRKRHFEEFTLPLLMKQCPELSVEITDEDYEERKARIIAKGPMYAAFLGGWAKFEPETFYNYSRN